MADGRAEPPRPSPAAGIGGWEASQIAVRVRKRDVSAVEVTRAALAAIARLDVELHAFCTVSPTALAEAETIDRRIAAGEHAGPLAGVPVAVKDLIATRGLRTTFGSRLYADHVPEEDDVVVERLRAAGAIILGKTNTSEFGYGAVGHNPLFSTTRNPWNPALTPGGSSAGSAAAVAAGIVPLALGSDGGGSVRVPAALCGIVGMKPSFGRIPLYPGCRDPAMPGASGWESLEHIGPLTRTVGDLALAMSVLAGPDPRDRHSIPDEGTGWEATARVRGARVAWSPDLGFARVDPDVAAVGRDAVQRLGRLLDVTVVADDPGIPDAQQVFEALVALDTDRAGLAALAHGRPVSSGVRAVLEGGWTADAFSAAILGRKAIANRLAAFFGRCDFLVTPTTATAAFAADSDGPAVIGGRAVAASAWTAFSAFANLAGVPALSIPAGFTGDGRPVGLQIVGPHLADRAVIALAAAIERVMPWAQHWPPLAAPAAAGIAA